MRDGGDISFDFGANVRWQDGPDNAAPWSGNTAAGKVSREEHPGKRAQQNIARTTDPVAVSEVLNHGRGYFAVIDDALQADAFYKHLLVGLDKLKEELRNISMLPSSKSESTPRKTGGRSGIQYLKVEDLSRQPKEAKILAVKADPDNKFGARVILKITMDGTTYFWGVAIKKNPNYELLEKKFGLDENDWAGQRILIGLEADDFTDQYFPRVSFPEGKKK